MNKLYDVALYYKENLNGKKFHLVAGKKGKTLDLDIHFREEHFKHLFGIHKLTDIPISRLNSEILYQRVLDRIITSKDIEASRFYNLAEERLNVFDKLKDTLFSKKLMIKSNKGDFKGIEADFILTKPMENEGNLHLFLKNRHNGIAIPVTYFPRNDNKFLTLNDTARWTVLSVEEITSPKTDNSQLKNVLRLDGVDKTTTVTPTLPTNNTTSTTANSIVSANTKRPKINKANAKTGKKGGWGGGAGL